MPKSIRDKTQGRGTEVAGQWCGSGGWNVVECAGFAKGNRVIHISIHISISANADIAPDIPPDSMHDFTGDFIEQSNMTVFLIGLAIHSGRR